MNNDSLLFELPVNAIENSSPATISIITLLLIFIYTFEIPRLIRKSILHNSFIYSFKAFNNDNCPFKFFLAEKQ